MDFGEFMTNFRMALTLNYSTGKYGFKNKEGFNQLQKKIYNGNEINLRGGGAVVVKANSSLDIPSNKGDNIVYFGSDEIDKELENHIKIIGENRYDTAIYKILLILMPKILNELVEWIEKKLLY